MVSYQSALNAANEIDIHEIEALPDQVANSYNREITQLRDFSLALLRKELNDEAALLISFKNATGIKAIKATDNVLLNKVRGWQEANR